MKLNWFAMDESRGTERNGATMKRVMEKKRIRERNVYDGFRRASVTLPSG